MNSASDISALFVTVSLVTFAFFWLLKIFPYFKRKMKEVDCAGCFIARLVAMLLALNILLTLAARSLIQTG